MLIEFNVPVVTVGKPARVKDTKTILASIKRRLEIPEFSTSQAPLAVRCKFGEEDSDGNEIEFREYREIDGTLYADVTPDILSGDISTLGELIRSHDGMPCSPPFHLVGRHIMDVLRSIPYGERRTSMYPSTQASRYSTDSYVLGPFTNIQEMALESHDEDMVEHCVELFDEAAKDIVFVDGRLHVKERPPVIQFSRVHAGWELKAVRRPMPGPIIRYADEDGGQQIPLAYFRIDQREEAIEFVSGWPKTKVRSKIDDLYVAPGAPVDFNSASALVRAVAVAINVRIVDFSHNNGGRGAISLLSAVMKPYEVLERELRNGDEENVSDHLVQAVETIMGGPPEIVENFVGDQETCGNYLRALEEWYDRPLAVDIASPRLLR